MKKWLKPCFAALSFCLLVSIGELSPATAAAECPGTNNGMRGHIWKEMDSQVLAYFWSGDCNSAGNPGTGRICTVCGKSQRFFTAGDWIYALRENGTAEIVRCNKPMEECSLVEIPSRLDGIPVTAIGDGAFRNCYWVQSVIIPEGITYIGDFAFEYCSSLNEITIPSSVESMGCNPFVGIRIKLHLPEDSKVLALIDGSLYTQRDKRLIYAYGEKDEKYRFNVPEGTLEIGDYAFSATAFSEITLPEGIRKIGNNAFEKCLQLKSVEIPEGTVEIGDFAFSVCSELCSLRLPGTLEQIGINPFYCTPVRLYISSDNSYYAVQDDVLFEKRYGDEKLISYPYAGDNVFYAIPDGTTEIENYAFAACDKLTHVKIPGSVQRIGENAFHGCHGLQAIALPDGMTVIESSTFSQCYLLKTIVIPDSVTEIGESAFFNCQALVRVSLPAGLQSLGEGAFEGCVSLYELKLPSGITEVPQSAFDGCIQLKMVTLPSGITKIEPFAFSYCASLEQIKLPDSLTAIGKYAFYGCKALEKVIIPESVATIGAYAFEEETKLIVR